MKNKKYLSFREIRKTHYIKEFKDEKKRSNIDLNDWKSAPYSFFKSIYYIEGSAILLFILQFTNITPNFVYLFTPLLEYSEVYLFLLIYQVWF